MLFGIINTNRSLLTSLLVTGLMALPQLAQATNVLIETPLGNIEIELLDEDAPNTVANFLNYVQSGRYQNTFIHRSDPGFIIQGGGFKFEDDVVSAVDAFPAVANEFGISNTRGTLAMAKLGNQPDSATSQWFINLGDNSGNLDAQNGGFTVFARVVGDGMTVADAISQLSRVDAGGAFGELPVIDFSGGTVLQENLVMTVVSETSVDTAELALQSVNAADGSHEPGETITVNYSVYNAGTGASGAVTLTLYASTDSNISSADTSLASVQITDIAAGATLEQQAIGNIPADIPEGNYFIGAILTFADSNTADNTAFDASTVTIKAVSEQSIGCDDDFVLAAVDKFEINVTANGVDDTLNLQCAINSAASTGMPVVRLASSTYRVSQLIARDFSGSLSGTTTSSTTLEILDGSIDCNAMTVAGRTPAAIKFDGGKARIERMTILAGSPCMTGSLKTVLHFTGESSLDESCANDVIFANVDRVNILGAGMDGLTETAVSVFAEGNFLDGCKQTLLGTFKLNRSLVSGFPVGLESLMKGSAQVDVSFNEFGENLVAIDMTDSNQNATITNNTINGDNTADSAYTGILAGTISDDAPTANRVVINNNTFNIRSTFVPASNAVLFDQQGNIANISTVITNNRFNLDGASTTGVISSDVNKGHIAANRFSGNGQAGVMVLADRTDVNGWTVTSNTGFASFLSSSADVVFGTGTRNCILGTGQGATFTDMGTGNSTPPGGN